LEPVGAGFGSSASVETEIQVGARHDGDHDAIIAERHFKSALDFDPDTGKALWSTALTSQYDFVAPPVAAQGIVATHGSGVGTTVYAKAMVRSLGRNTSTGAALEPLRCPRTAPSIRPSLHPDMTERYTPEARYPSDTPHQHVEVHIQIQGTAPDTPIPASPRGQLHRGAFEASMSSQCQPPGATDERPVVQFHRPTHPQLPGCNGRIKT
jgi:hypothetical protein